MNPRDDDVKSAEPAPSRLRERLWIVSWVLTVGHFLIALPPVAHVALVAALAVLWYTVGIGLTLIAALIVLQAPVFYVMWKVAGAPAGESDTDWPPP